MPVVLMCATCTFVNFFSFFFFFLRVFSKVAMSLGVFAVAMLAIAIISSFFISPYEMTTFEAAFKGDVPMLQLLFLSNKTSVNDGDNWQNTALHVSLFVDSECLQCPPVNSFGWLFCCAYSGQPREI